MAPSRSATAHAEHPLTSLLPKAAGRKSDILPHAGDITPAEAFEYMQSAPAVLVDVRTLPEWQFTGVPDLAGTQGALLTVSWKTYPSFALNPAFADMLEAEKSVDTETPLFFLCRSGGRSLDAAVAMAGRGYRYCFNISGGFEGEPDAQGHRGVSQGWKAAQLPWKQG